MKIKKVLCILICLTFPLFGYPGKEKVVSDYIALQSKVLEIVKRNPAPFEPRTSGLNKEVKTEISRLGLNEMNSMQLYRIGVSCSMASYPQEAGDERIDLIFDFIAWECVRIIASRPGYQNNHYLKRMKAVFGWDAGPSLMFKDYMENQRMSESEQDAAQDG